MRRLLALSAVLLAGTLGLSGRQVAQKPTLSSSTLAATGPTDLATNPPRVPASEVTVYSLFPVSSRTVWAYWGADNNGVEQGLELTNDSGRTWTDVTPPGLDEAAGNKFILNVFALDALHAWATYGRPTYGLPGSEATQTMVSTSDSGRHWTVVGRVPGYGCHLQFVTALDGWCPSIGAAMGSAGVDLYRTTNGGRHWTLVSSTTPQTHTLAALPFGCDKTIRFTSVNVGWAVFFCNGGLASLYETTDGGARWIQREVATPPFSFAFGGFSGIPQVIGNEGAVGYQFIRANGFPRTVVYVTEDAGTSWHAVLPPGPGRPWAVDALTPRSWRLIDGDEILATTNAGRSWSSFKCNVSFSPDNVSLVPGPIDFINDEVGWISNLSPQTGGHLLWRTNDGGVIWIRVTVPGE